MAEVNPLQATHALVVLLDESWERELGFDDHHVRLFESEEACIAWAIARLIEHEIIFVRDVDGAFVFSDSGENYQTADDALDAFQSGLGSLEYFHVKPIR